eukprot:g12274.t1
MCLVASHILLNPSIPEDPEVKVDDWSYQDRKHPKRTWWKQGKCTFYLLSGGDAYTAIIRTAEDWAAVQAMAAPPVKRYDRPEAKEGRIGAGMKIAIIRARWNKDVVEALQAGCVKALLAKGVAEENIILKNVSGSYELPFAAKSLIATRPDLDAVVCIGTLIKGETMHFEYICEAVSQGLMRVGLDTGTPVIFGVLTCLNEEQAKSRAGLTKGGHNHGVDWGQAAVEMASYKFKKSRL